MNIKTRNLTIYALLTAIAFVLSAIDNMIPLSITIPGLKLGLANTVTMAALIYFGPRAACAILFTRCLLAGVTFGNFMSFSFSITGGLLALLVMFLLIKGYNRWFSIYGVSIAGSCFHHIGQIGIACIYTKTVGIISYLPLLLIGSIFTGLVTGLICSIVFSRLEASGVFPRLQST